MVNEKGILVECPICKGADFFPHERNGAQMLKCVKCGKEHKMEEIFKPSNCEDGACKI